MSPTKAKKGNRLQFCPLNNLTPLFHTGSLRLCLLEHSNIYALSELIPMNNETQTSGSAYTAHRDMEKHLSERLNNAELWANRNGG